MRKSVLGIIILFLIFLPIIPRPIYAQLDPPGEEDVKSAWASATDTVSNVFWGLDNFFKKLLERITPFFQNIGQKITSFWLETINPLILRCYFAIKNYLFQTITIK